MAIESDPLIERRSERSRLRALARIAGAAATGGVVDGVLAAIAQGVRDAFGLDTVLNLYDSERDCYVVRAGVGAGSQELMGAEYPCASFDRLLLPTFEVVPDIFFIPHDAAVDLDSLGATHVPDHPWRGEGHWHPLDMCFVMMRTSRGAALGILSVDSSVDQRVPDAETFELIRLFAQVGANAAENATLVREIAGLEEERELRELRRAMQEELALRESLLEIGGRVQEASAAAPEEILPVVSERLRDVVQMKSLTIWAVDVDAEEMRAVHHSEPEVAAAVLAFRFPWGHGATGRAAVMRRTNAANHGQPGQGHIDIPGTPDEPEHVLAVPVVVEERARVVLTLRRDASDPPFGHDDVHRAELYAQHLTSALLLAELAEHRSQLADQVDQLERLNRLKDEFVANVSHELRTPLTAVIGNVMTVAGLGDMLGAGERRELLVAAERQAKRLAELLENLLAESRLSAGDPAVRPVRIDVGPFLDEVADTLRFRAPGRQVQTEVDDGLQVTTDRTLLYRVLFNLGDNALKYSDGPVVICGREDGHWIRFEVRDRGIGIAQEHLGLVFEQFGQVDRGDGRTVGGVGLGLHLVARAVEALSGRIEVDSRLGEGSTFTIWLPSLDRLQLPIEP